MLCDYPRECSHSHSVFPHMEIMLFCVMQDCDVHDSDSSDSLQSTCEQKKKFFNQARSYTTSKQSVIKPNECSIGFFTLTNV